MAAHILVFGKLKNIEDQKAFETTCNEVGRTILKSTEECMRVELARDTNDPTLYTLLTQWKSRDIWANWQRSPLYREFVSPLHQYWTHEGMRVCETTFCLDELEPANLFD